MLKRTFVKVTCSRVESGVAFRWYFSSMSIGVECNTVPAIYIVFLMRCLRCQMHFKYLYRWAHIVLLIIKCLHDHRDVKTSISVIY